MRVWKVATGHEIFALSGHSKLVWCVAYSPDGQCLASASFDTTVKIWDARTGREMGTLTGHSAPVMSVTFSRDGRWLASGSGDMSIRTDGETKIWGGRSRHAHPRLSRGTWTARVSSRLSSSLGRSNFFPYLLHVRWTSRTTSMQRGEGATEFSCACRPPCISRHAASGRLEQAAHSREPRAIGYPASG